MVSVASVVSWLWFQLAVLCLGYGVCCQCCVLDMVSVASVVCWLWFLVPVLCVVMVSVDSVVSGWFLLPVLCVVELSVHLLFLFIDLF